MVRPLKSAHVDVGIHFFLSKFFEKKVNEIALSLLDDMDSHDACTPWSPLHCMAFDSRCPMFQISGDTVMLDSWLPHCNLYGFSFFNSLAAGHDDVQMLALANNANFNR